MISNEELELTAYSKICEIIKKNIDGKTILTKETTSDDLMMDSLDKIELLMWCEEAFDVDLSDETWEKCDTIGDIHKLILESRPTIDCSPPKQKVVEKVESKSRWSWGGWLMGDFRKTERFGQPVIEVPTYGSILIELSENDLKQMLKVLQGGDDTNNQIKMLQIKTVLEKVKQHNKLSDHDNEMIRQLLEDM